MTVAQLGWLDEADVEEDLQLVYCSSRDGTTGRYFHCQYAYRGCTLTIIETTHGLIVGVATSNNAPSFGSLKGCGCATNMRNFFLSANKAFCTPRGETHKMAMNDMQIG